MTPACNELLTQFRVVVQLAVVDESEASPVVVHRLTAGVGEVDDAEATVTQRDRVVAPETAGIRAAVDERLRHRRDSSVKPFVLAGSRGENSGYAAHISARPVS